MLRKFHFSNWSRSTPSNLLEYMYTPSGLGLRLINFICQKVFRINSKVPFMVHFTSAVSGRVEVGRNVVSSLANSGGCYIQGINGVIIGADTIFAPGVKIISANHAKDNISSHILTEKPVKIGNNCWLGANAVILPGVELGDGVIVAAGSVVTKSFPANVVVAGVPAKLLKPAS